MKPSLLPLLRCPVSHTALTLTSSHERNGMIWSGTLRSAAGQTWQINHGIVDLLPRAASKNGAQLVNRLPLAAWGYERVWRPYALSLLSGHTFPLSEETALMLEHLAARRGGVFLDLACSTAVYGRALARALPDTASAVISLDHSLPMLQEAQRRAQAEGVQLTLIRGLAEDLPLADAALAGVACGGSFNEFTHPDRVLSEVRRTLKPDGRSWWMQARQATTPAGRWLQRGMRPGGVTFPSGDELAQSLTAAGLSVTFDQREGAVQLIATRGRVIAPI